MVRIDRVYTRKGDRGETHLVGGQKVDKDSARIEAYGTVDELNAVVGLVRELARVSADLGDEVVRGVLVGRLGRVQQELFDLGSELATLDEDLARFGERIPRANEAQVGRLEAEMDEMNAELPALTSFILPGGGLLSAQLHQARTVCRRAERRVVSLSRESVVGPQVVPYLNRLSDYFFVLGRWAALKTGRKDELWNPQRDRS